MTTTTKPVEIKPTRFSTQNEALAWANIMGRHGTRYRVHQVSDGYLHWVAERIEDAA